MRILRDPRALQPCVLVLGMFDGVHRGHQALLMAGLALAEENGLPLNVCTFEPHPMRVLRPEKAPPLLTTLTERARLMADFGVDNLCILPFNMETAAQSPEDFMAALVAHYQPRHVVCGFNFTFGYRGMGNGESLRAYGADHGFAVTIVPEVVLGGESVSSTRIRGLLEKGSIHEATRLLGHSYSLSGRVMDGKHIGRTMGYPTANVAIPQGKVLPAFGVYACWMQAGEFIYPAVVNVGRHPTLPEGSVTVEAYALDEELSLYGQKVRLLFLDFLRPEKKFDGVEQLKAQIDRDAQEAREYFDELV
ncbi:MAG: bifunctional riboflavin kinase/FAD synthetase [Clostridia bacterium]|nr:bifunctional riboflavin kinase/FAD synthetase [Clostridia bacterium]